MSRNCPKRFYERVSTSCRCHRSFPCFARVLPSFPAERRNHLAVPHHNLFSDSPVGDTLPQSEHMTQISKRRTVHVQGSTYNWLGNPSNLPCSPMRNMAVNTSWLRRGYIRQHAIGRMLTVPERGAIYQDSCICRLGRDAVTIWHAYIGSWMR